MAPLPEGHVVDDTTDQLDMGDSANNEGCTPDQLDTVYSANNEGCTPDRLDMGNSANIETTLVTSDASKDVAIGEVKTEAENAADNKSDGDSLLFRLPRELRDQIYKEMYDSHLLFHDLGRKIDPWFFYDVVLDTLDGRYHSLVSRISLRWRQLPLLLTCRRVYNEACQVLYGKLRFESWEHARWFLVERPHAAKHIKLLVIKNFVIPYYWAATFRMLDFFENITSLQRGSAVNGCESMPQIRYISIACLGKDNEIGYHGHGPHVAKKVFKKLMAQIGDKWNVKPAILGMSQIPSDYDNQPVSKVCRDCRREDSDFVNVYNDYINRYD